MKYNKTQIDHVLRRFDQAAHEEFKKRKEKLVPTVFEAKIPVTVNIKVFLDDCYYNSASGESYSFDHDFNSYALRNQAIDMLKKQKATTADLKKQKAILEFRDRCKANRTRLEDALILGDSDAMGLLQRFIDDLDN